MHAALRLERRRAGRSDGGYREAHASALPRRRLRLRHQAQHPAPAGRSRLPADRRAGADEGAPTCSRCKPDGVFLSNGPGDPEPCTYAIAAIREIVDGGMPTFGICLGHQLLGLASGARTVKMKFGHHGANHPVLDQDTGQVLITSQNHGFAVDAATLPANVARHARVAVRRQPAGHRAHRPPRVQLPGPPGGEPRAARSRCICSTASCELMDEAK